MGFAIPVADGLSFVSAMRRVIVAARGKPVQTGDTLSAVCLHSLRGATIAAATDCLRLAREPVALALPDALPKLILERGPLAKLLRRRSAESVTMIDGDDGWQCSFRSDKGKVIGIVPMLKGMFPRYDDAIPTDFARSITIPVAETIAAVEEIVALSGTPNVRPVSGSLGPLLISIGPDFVLSRGLVAHIHLSQAVFGFNPEFLLDGLRAIGNGPCTIRFSGSSSPAVLTGETVPEFEYVLMPMETVASVLGRVDASGGVEFMAANGEAPDA